MSVCRAGRVSVCLLASLLCLVACRRGSVPVQPVGPVGEPGVILLAPPRDVVQKGLPHEVGADTGEYLASYMQGALQKRGYVTAASSDARLNTVEVASEDVVLGEARRLGASYALRVILGEFRNAAPMTFRTDFVTLQQADLWEATTGKLLWSSGLPIMFRTNNLGSHERLLDRVGDLVVTQVTARVAPGAPRGGGTGAAGQTNQAAPSPSGTEQRLRELLRLKEQGLITTQEFEAKRTEILDEF